MIYHGEQTDGFTPNLSDLRRAVDRTTADLRPHASLFDSLVTQGMSGVIVGAPVALRLRKELVIVRKDEDTRHARETVMNLANAGKRWLFLDDFVSSGRTRARVQAQYGLSRLTCAGSYLYADRRLELAEVPGPSFTPCAAFRPVTATTIALTDYVSFDVPVPYMYSAVTA